MATEIKENPKLKGLLLSSQKSRDVVLRALHALLDRINPDDDDYTEATRLVTRLKARL